MTNDIPSDLHSRAARPDTPLDPAYRARLEEALRSLPRRRRAIFLAACWDKLPNVEIAQRSGLTIRRVEREIAKALVHLDRAVSDPRPAPWWKQLWQRWRQRRR